MGKVLAIGWTAFAVALAILGVAKAVWGTIFFPHLYALKPILFVLIFGSFVYATYRVYRRGMDRAN
jgi:hypothetical protein